MTREEVLNILSRLAGNTTQPSWSEIRNATKFAIDLIDHQQPPLSEDLEEAAYHHVANNGGRWLTDDIGIKCFAFNPQEVKDAFKAGAKWQAEQGVIAETGGWLEDSKEAPNYDMLLVVDPLYIPYGEHGLKYNDKVIVQIRKKDE